MSPRLPPRDPLEPSGMPPDDLELLAPIKVFLQGPPSRGVERVADAILAARPGMLLICIRG